MDERIFDAMLKTALEEALQEDTKELDKLPPVRQSWRQRRRMRKMLADPWRYARCLRASGQQAEPRRRKNLARWLAVAVIAALLTGTAAGYALRSGDFFRQMFDESPWAAQYSGAADTEQVLNMGGGGLGVAVEDEHFRFELLDAISEGENAMAAVRITVLNMEPLEEAFGTVSVAPGRFLTQDGSFLDTGTSSASYVYPGDDESLAENQMLMIFRTAGNQVGGEQTYSIDFHDFGYTKGFDENGWEETAVLIPGDWSVPVKLDFDGGTVLERDELVQLETCAFTVDQIRLSALTVGMDIHCAVSEVDAVFDLLRDAVVRMEDGTEVPCTGFRLSGKGEDEEGFASEALFEFELPLEKERYDSIVVQGHEISLRK